MKPSHKRWKEFTERLAGSEECNFKLKDKNDPKSYIWKCSGGDERPFATAILEKMGNTVVIAIVKYYLMLNAKTLKLWQK